jgi:hypothetical protein
LLLRVGRPPEAGEDDEDDGIDSGIWLS